MHKSLGKLYVLCVVISAIAAAYLGFYAICGLLSKLGFICLAILWFYFTLSAYRHILNQELTKHQIAMIYSYALCFATVTLRIWLPLLSLVFQEFESAYTITGWMCWLPNVLFAYWLIKRNEQLN